MVGFGSIANLGTGIPLGETAWLPVGLPPLDLTAALSGILVVLLGLFGASALGILAAADRREHRERVAAIRGTRPADVVPLRRARSAGPTAHDSVDGAADASGMPARAGAA